MSHGTPDWGVTAGAVTVYQLTDLAELAARLGSIVTHDRRGDVIFLEDFEGGLGKWTKSVVGAGGAIDLSTVTARSGRYSCRLVGGSAAPLGSGITRALPFVVLSGMGVEFSFALPGTVDYIDLAVSLYDGVNVTDYEIRWRDAQNDLQYAPAVGDLETFQTGVTPFVRASLFHTMKLVLSGADGEYARLLLDNSSYSLADIAAAVTTSTQFPRLEITVAVGSRSTHNDTIRVDDVIVTQNEPL